MTMITLVLPELLRRTSTSAGNRALAEMIAPCVGLFFVAFGLILYIRELLRYTKRVSARCIDVVEYRSRKGAREIAPVWEYEYQGNIITVKDPSASTIRVVQKGSTCTMYINPRNPREFRRKGLTLGLKFLLFGVFFTIFALLTT